MIRAGVESDCQIATAGVIGTIMNILNKGRIKSSHKGIKEKGFPKEKKCYLKFK